MRCVDYARVLCVVCLYLFVCDVVEEAVDHPLALAPGVKLPCDCDAVFVNDVVAALDEDRRVVDILCEVHASSESAAVAPRTRRRPLETMVPAVVECVPLIVVVQLHAVPHVAIRLQEPGHPTLKPLQPTQLHLLHKMVKIVRRLPLDAQVRLAVQLLVGRPHLHAAFVVCGVGGDDVGLLALDLLELEELLDALLSGVGGVGVVAVVPLVDAAGAGLHVGADEEHVGVGLRDVVGHDLNPHMQVLLPRVVIDVAQQ
mmetsp:Transcript_25760/g.63903  ORF Transcript_25760/g.63903 Transcript_25760/m.63903 type:complete len:257 (+) Transcript_25760:250-1020(+)